MTTLLQVPLFDDEVLPSYISRLARANGNRSAILMCRDFRISYDKLLIGDQTAIDQLAGLTIYDSLRLTYSAVVVGERKTVTLAGETFEKSDLHLNEFHFCPKCFADDERRIERMPGTRRYRRTAWLIGGVKTCVHHACRLEVLHKYRRVTDFSTLLDSRKLEIDGHTRNVRTATPDALEAFIYERMLGKKEHGDFFNDTSLHVAIDISRFIGVALAFGKTMRHVALSRDQLDEALRRGFRFLRDEGFGSALDALASEATPNSTGIYSTYGTLTELLLARRKSKDYDRLRELLHAHAGTTIAARQRSQFQMGLGTSKSWTSLTEIADQTGLGRYEVWTRLTGAGFLIAGQRAGKIPTTAMELFDGPMRDLVTPRNVYKILGCNRETYDGLVEAGLLTPIIVKRGPDKASVIYLTQADVQGLRAAIYRQATNKPTSDMVSLRKASTAAGKSKAELIAGILNGTIEAAALNATSSILDDILIARRFATLIDPHLFPATHVTKKLGLQHDTMTALLAKGIMPFIESTEISNGYTQRLIHQRDIAAFQANYITIGQLAKESGLTQNELRKRARSRDVQFAFPHSEVKTCLMLRTEISRLF